MNNFQNEAHFFILEKFQTLTEEHHIRLHQLNLPHLHNIHWISPAYDIDHEEQNGSFTVSWWPKCNCAARE